MVNAYLTGESASIKFAPGPAPTMLRKILPSKVSEIIAATALDHRIPLRVIFSPSRTKQATQARHEMMWRLRRMPWRGTIPSFPQIGRWLDRHHTTIIHGVRKHQERIESGEAPDIQ